MKILGTLFLGVFLFFYAADPPLLEQIKKQGELRVITRYGPTTYYEGEQGAAGLEYELAKRFAEELNVKLRLIVSDSFTDILQQVADQQVHFAAAGLTVTPTRKAVVRFAPHYQEIKPQVVYHRDRAPPPQNLADWNSDYRLQIIAGGNQVDILKQLKPNYPHLQWSEVSDLEPSELLEQVWEKEIPYALVGSNEMVQMRRFYPELEIGLELPETQPVAWAFSRSSKNDSLYLAAIQFFNRLQQSGELEQLIERYYGHLDNVEQFNFTDIRSFHQHIKERLPHYRNDFEMIAARYQLDWRLLAAMGYQESKWDPNATSVTGVRGLMMLTQSTAREMGVTHREDPLESVEGAAKYLLAIKERLSRTIPEPDRTWLALAAYNVGPEHLRDARRLTKQFGDNPHYWVDVKKHLPKLTQPQWYKQTKYGYARGYEPVQFVKNVRRFYDILVRLETEPKLIETSSSPPNLLSGNLPILQ
ncbi:putative soluble lytic transglycosylase fused to an ABC-type amino acid-binding protein [Thioploca ingrica]|uniref:Membrane-bound lytic murein transglycosylase F n=1 Tax=Thioploca ingrica TaxID=40754 RepID=A0A090AM14_9GAMM|nr:putative soluble lytic transglycosylase fused to an ABC-type amino acid-binding protein [Thioploca ingrica]